MHTDIKKIILRQGLLVVVVARLIISKKEMLEHDLSPGETNSSSEDSL
jgi:hypothetical protein